jgi:mannose-6-phosphate isomerase-like protein (cupin superfamily)
MPIVRRAEMISGRPLPGWTGRFFHSPSMTFAYWDIAEGAAPLHEHHHTQEEVWHVVEGQIALTIEGVEHVVSAGTAAVIPPDTAHAARPLGTCRAIVCDYPLRTSLPGMAHARTSE